MSITSGIIIQCTDQNVSGGIKTFFLANCDEWEAATFDITTSPPDVTILPAALEVFYLFRAEKFKTLTNGTQEGGGVGSKFIYEFQFFLPGNDSATLEIGRQIQKAGKLLLITEDYEGVWRVYGWDTLLELQASGMQTAVADDTGGDLAEGDQKGVTYTVRFEMGELARISATDPNTLI